MRPTGPKPLVRVESQARELSERLTQELSRWGYRVSRSARDAVRDGPAAVDVVLRDIGRRPLEDVELHAEVQPETDAPPTILIGRDLGARGALAAEQAGFAGVISTPLDWEQLRALVSRALVVSRNQRRLARLRNDILQAGGPDLVWGREPVSPWLSRIERIAESAAPVLLWGEPGTGKRSIARAIHALSSRSPGPFVAAGDTGAPRRRIEDAAEALFRRADGGTLLIEEITALPDAEQWDLAGLLEAQLDGRLERTPDVRVIATSSSDPLPAVDEGQLREDLYYRLAVFVLPTLPLRARRAEIPALADHFLRAANRRHGLAVEGLTPTALRRLSVAEWPGNLPQLRSALEQGCILAEVGLVDAHHLPPHIRREGSGPPAQIAIAVGTTAAEAERKLILATLERTGFNKAEAARQLQLDVKTIRNKLRTYGLA